jgi:hypothetical protein
MEVNKLDSREVLLMLFGLPLMVTLIVLLSIAVGHYVTTRSDRPTNVTVSAPAVSIPAPQVHLTAPAPKIDVNVPQAAPPVVNVSTPPAKVTVLDRREYNPQPVPPTQPVPPLHAAPDFNALVSPVRLTAAPAQNSDALPAPADPASATSAAPSTPAQNTATQPGESRTDNPDNNADNSGNAGTQDLQSIPVSAEQHKSSANTPRSRRVNFSEEELTLDTLYRYAEKYIDSYCRKNKLDPVQEGLKWNRKWKQNVEQAIADNIDTSEQTYINRMVLQKRDCFDIEKANPDQIVEGCRIMLRYRDGQLAWLQAMRDAATNENIKKTLVFLAAGAP